jgi:FkbM family methyltransferase
MRFLRKLKRSVLKRIVRLVWGDRFFLTRYLGARFLVRGSDQVGREIATGTYDPDRFKYLIAACRRLKPDLFVDVGANCGLYTCVLLSHGVVPRAVAFEPDRRNAALLRTNLLINNLLERVTVREQAAGRGPGRLRLVPGPESNTGSSRLVAGAEAEEGYEVEVVRLDDALDWAGGCIAAKIDVEWHELETLAGMTRLLDQSHGLVQIESWDQTAEVEAVMMGHGWRRTAAFPPDLIFEKG